MASILLRIKTLLKRKAVQKRIRRGISVVSCVVVFGTTYSLLLPALTLEARTVCGMEEHQHSQECYEEVLVCGMEESDGHHHTEECYDEAGELICGQEESEGHHHDSSCYETRLTCGLENHIHTAECYKKAEEDSVETDASETEVQPQEEQTGQESTSVTPVNNVAEIAAPSQKSTIKFAEYLSDYTGILCQPEGAGSNEWKPADSALRDRMDLEPEMIALNSEEQVLLHIAYKLPAGTINETNAVTEYELPLLLEMTSEEVRENNKYQYQVFADTDREADPLKEAGTYEIEEKRNGKGEVTERKLVIRWNADTYRRCGGEKLTDGTVTIQPSEVEGFFELLISADELLTLEEDAGDENARVLYWGKEKSKSDDFSTVILFDEETLKEEEPAEELPAQEAENVEVNTEPAETAEVAPEITTETGEQPETQPEATEPEVEVVAEPVYAAGTLTYDGGAYIAEVTFDQSAQFPEGTVFTAKEVKGTAAARYGKKAAAALEGKEINSASFYTLHFEDADGNTVVPAEGSELAVRIQYRNAEIIAEGTQMEGICLARNTAEPFAVQVSGVADGSVDVVSFTAIKSAVYGILNTEEVPLFNKGVRYAYSIERDKEVSLPEIFDALRIMDEETGTLLKSEDVQQVESSNEALLSVTHKTKFLGLFGKEEWLVKGLKPFTSEEMLTVTLKDGRILKIAVSEIDFVSYVMTADGEKYKVSVSYDAESGIPSDASLAVEEIPEDSEEYAAYMAEVEAALAAGRKVQMAKLFDITILDREGNEVEPLTPVRVNIEFVPEEVPEGTNIELYHFQTDGETPQVMENVEVHTDEANTVNGIEFETDGFSVYGVVYTVDFYWEVDGEVYEYSLPGGGYISLHQLLELIGVVEKEEETGGRDFFGEIAKVEFSSPELVSVSKVEEDTTVGAIKEALHLECEYSADLTDKQIETINRNEVKAGDWALISLKAFDTEETLTISMINGEVFAIRVTDDQENPLGLDGKTYSILGTQNNRSYYLDNVVSPSNNNNLKATEPNNWNASGTAWTFEWTGTDKNYLIHDNNGKYIIIQDDNKVTLTTDRNQALENPITVISIEGKYSFVNKNNIALNITNNYENISFGGGMYDASSNAFRMTLQLPEDVRRPGTVTTADTSEGITINLFNYGPEDQLDTVSHHNGNPADAGVNVGHSLKFFSYGNVVGNGINDFTGAGNGPQTGIVSDTLGTDNYPVLRSNGESLDYLFGGSPNSSVTGYYGLNHLFIKDENEYYHYDSDTNYAYYDTSNGNKDFTVYSKTFPEEGADSQHFGVGFFPFNDYDEHYNCIHGRDFNWDKDYSRQGHYDHHFGMEMKAEFTYLPGGQYNGNDISYHFSGDDDMWVFVDGILVMDIGGIHNPVSGDINFRTGAVTVHGVAQENFKDKYKRITGNDWDDSDYSTHDFRVFYMERGGMYSNLEVEFNLPTFKTIAVEKQMDGLTEEQRQLFKDVEFKYELLLNGELYNGNQTVRQDKDGNVIEQGFTISNGEITIKDGEVVAITHLTSRDVFSIAEKNLEMSQYNAPDADRVYLDAEGEKHTEQITLTEATAAYQPLEGTKTWKSDVYYAKDTEKIIIKNKPLVGSLRIDKLVTYNGEAPETAEQKALLAGTYVFKIFKNEACTIPYQENGVDKTISITIGEDGAAQSSEPISLPVGNYWIREDTPQNDTTPEENQIKVSVTQNHTTNAPAIVSFKNNKEVNDGEDEIAIELEKIFTGLEASNLPEGFQVILNYKVNGTDAEPIVLTNKTEGNVTWTPSEDGLTWGWRITHINPKATDFTVKENNYLKAGYIVVTKINGEVVEDPSNPGPIEVIAPTIVMGGASTDYQTTDNYKVFEVKEGQILLVRLTAGESTLVISPKVLSLAVRDEITRMIKDHELQAQWKLPIHFFSKEMHGDKFSFAGRTIFFDGDLVKIPHKASSHECRYDVSITTETGANSFVLENNYTEIPISIDIIKVDQNDDKIKLPGAVFTLRQIADKEPTSGGTYESAEGSSPINSDPTAEGTGKTGFTNLTHGYYEITETNPPAGYVFSKDLAVYFKIQNGKVIWLEKGTGKPSTWQEKTSDDMVTFEAAKEGSNDTFTVKNEPGVALPSAGGPGTWFFTALGSLLIVFATVMINRRRLF